MKTRVLIVFCMAIFSVNVLNYAATSDMETTILKLQSEIKDLQVEIWNARNLLTVGCAWDHNPVKYGWQCVECPTEQKFPRPVD